jgi:uncharacterized protein YndB with AHSA1/START domain
MGKAAKKTDPYACPPLDTPEQRAFALIKLAAICRDDPGKFIRAAFPWGEPGPLKDKRPRKWLMDLCESIKQKIVANRSRPGEGQHIIQEATASGHGIGKSAGMAQLTLWAMCTNHCRGVVTANTDRQLKSTTWTELAKWFNMCIFRHSFNLTATQLRHKTDDTWRIDAKPWSVNNTEAFAGLHNEGQRVFLGFDEASGIDDPVWETAEGALTDANTQIIWVVWGNPTRSSGRFRKCFSDLEERKLWTARNVDSRMVEGTNKDRIERWRKIYGEDSQFFNVRVKGQFVEADPDQLISLSWIADARMRGETASSDGSQAKLRVSVDVASGGEDASVFTTMVHYQSFRHLIQQTEASFDKARGAIESAKSAKIIFESRLPQFPPGPHDIVVDTIGVGDGCAGHLIDQKMPVVTYKGGEQSSQPDRFRNTRVQCYIALRNDLRDGRIAIAPDALPDEESWLEFEQQMCSVKSKPGVEKLEDLVTKDEMMRAGIKSPDRADSLAMQYAHKAVTRLASASKPMRAKSVPSETAQADW